MPVMLVRGRASRALDESWLFLYPVAFATQENTLARVLESCSSDT